MPKCETPVANGAVATATKLGPKRRAAAFKRKASLKIAQEVPQKPKRRKRNSDDAYRAQAAKSEAKTETSTAGVKETPVEEQARIRQVLLDVQERDHLRHDRYH